MMAPITNAGVDALLAANTIPPGYAYSLVLISLTKRLLAREMPTRERLEFLEQLEPSADERWLTPEMISAVAPMDEKGLALAGEAMKLGKRGLDMFAKHFATFAVLNPSLVTVLQMMPGHRAMELCQQPNRSN
jgi:hypothetical protein